ncbi:MAG TPA: hypothetical protein EYP47_00545 [Methanococcaceae archaeon]|nr:hypothetical protein [Methanococcaceae archaeon]
MHLSHHFIKRYPVTARRWRDEILLTIASIAVFQPWVTKGIGVKLITMKPNTPYFLKNSSPLL